MLLQIFMYKPLGESMSSVPSDVRLGAELLGHMYTLSFLKDSTKTWEPLKNQPWLVPRLGVVIPLLTKG